MARLSEEEAILKTQADLQAKLRKIDEDKAAKAAKAAKDAAKAATSEANVRAYLEAQMQRSLLTGEPNPAFFRAYFDRFVSDAKATWLSYALRLLSDPITAVTSSTKGFTWMGKEYDLNGLVGALDTWLGIDAGVTSLGVASLIRSIVNPEDGFSAEGQRVLAVKEALKAEEPIAQPTDLTLDDLYWGMHNKVLDFADPQDVTEELGVTEVES